MPNPRPYSASCDVSSYWDSKVDIKKDIEGDEQYFGNGGIEDVGIQTTVSSAQLNGVDSL